MAGRIAILTGPRGVGKSTICYEACVQARARRRRPAGIITCRGADDSLEVLNVSDGARRQLTIQAGCDTPVAVVQGRFRFDPATLAWGNDLLSRALPCDLLVIDEIGPLEATRRQGWTAAFDILMREEFALAMVVVRPELVSWARSIWWDVRVSVLSVTTENRDDAPALIVKMLEDELSFSSVDCSPAARGR